ncbi:MAG: ATP synthase F1 subunit delta [Phycisphaerales bacterium]|nr:ATP synthase F1 subunit delta [Phycisphaerales bacterium]
MPLIEAQPDALAKVYAKSLFEIAQSQGGQQNAESILGELEDIIEIARNDRSFNELLASRLIDAKKRDASLVRMFEGKVSTLTLNFIRQLNRKGRLANLSQIAVAMDTLVQEQFGRIEVDVFTASPISASELENVRKRLSDSLGKDVIMHPYTDSSMLGGIKLRMGDQLIDGSIQAELRKMRDVLLNKGSAEVRGRSGDILGN